MAVMKRASNLVVWAVLIFIASASSGQARDEPRIEIPLNKIWALDMPGTRDIRQMKPVGSDKRYPVARLPKLLDSWFTRIRYVLARKPPEAEAEAGFAIGPISLRSLDLTSYVLMKGGDEPPRYQSSARKTAAVFFSHPSAYRVQLEHVERRGKIIDIHYRFVPHFSSESTFHYALIPLGKLPAGEYRVQIQQLPMEQKYIDAGFKPVGPVELRRIVCKPFSFIVKDPPAPDPGLDKDAIIIPLNNIWAYNMPGVPNAQSLGTDHSGSLLARQISQAIWHRAGKKQQIEAGFAVAGSGLKALEAVKEIMVQNQVPSQTFSTDSEFSLFFFTRNSKRHIYLKDVRLSNETVTIRYFIPKISPTGINTMSSTQHFALIPLSKLPTGNYAVDIVEFSMENKHEKQYRLKSKERIEKIICKPFVFSIESPATKAKINE